jgi:hypothetical protein
MAESAPPAELELELRDQISLVTALGERALEELLHAAQVRRR